MYMFTYFSKKLTFKNPYVILFQRVYILPLRNENKHIVSSFSSASHSLYPTFKEWKQLPCVTVILINNVYILPLRNENPDHIDSNINTYRLYPTFKEWKPLYKKIFEMAREFISYL